MALNATATVAAAEDEYRRRLQTHQARAARAAQRDLRLGAAKLVVAFLLLALAWLALISHLLSALWVWLPVAVLVALFVAHDRVLRARVQAERTAAFYERRLARIENRWAGTGPSGQRFRDPAHPYAEDLDLFGDGSLFELICAARSPMGEDRLAAWMSAPAPPDVIRRRQSKITAARDDLDQREQVAALGDELKQKMDPARFAAWAQAPVPQENRAARVAVILIGAASIAALAWAFASGAWAPFFVLALVQAVLIYGGRSRWGAVLGNMGANREGLLLFAEVLRRIPGHPAGFPGPAELRRLGRLADWIEASESLLGRILDITVLYSLQLAFAANAWRRRCGPQVTAWLEAVGEFEALLSLAGYAFEHPADPYAEFLDTGAGPAYHADDLGHPLLPEALCVRNSITLDAATRLLLVSGSNMSGKSTLLRTVGLNAVLAQMGAPVRAQSLRLTPLALGTRLRTVDSLQQGRSGFYAEILRLRQVFELASGPLPVLFLFDELMEGTNSHDRVLGAAGLLRALLARPSLGLVTTHDLALAALAAELGPAVRNVHFEDQIEGNDARFDHRLREGVVTKSNALALMRIIGLEV